MPDYIPWGMDATIYWGSLDYKFRNNTTYPIRILAEASGGYVRVRFMGTETKDYTVELDYKAAMTHKSKTEEVEISKGMKNYDKYKDYKDGERIQVGYDGYEVDTYRMKYDKNGKLLSTEKVNHSQPSGRQARRGDGAPHGGADGADGKPDGKPDGKAHGAGADGTAHGRPDRVHRRR